MESNKSDPSIICRTCMCEGGNMRSVFHKLQDGKSATDLLEIIANITINSDDNLPKQICDKCERFLCKAAYFKSRCLDVEVKLTKLFNNESRSSLSLIKHENKAPESTDEPYQCSICFSKYSEIALLEKHVFNFHQLKKVSLFNEFSLFANAKANLITLETVSEKEENESLVKEEINSDYVEDSNFDNVYSEHDAESLLIEFEPKIDKDTFEAPVMPIDNDKIDNLEKEKYECGKCNHKFKSANSLNLHKRKHKEKKDIEKKYQCSLCMRKFISKSGLTNHLSIHGTKDDVKYTCGRCKREFKHKAHLDNHMVTLHANEKGFTCDFCLKNFATQESLEIHKDLHKIDKKHSCQYCNKSFYMLSTLTDHIRTHTGEKPYLCSTCGRGFSQKTNLAQHMRRHLGLKPFACDHCTQRFVSKGELVAHTRKHSGAHPFICDECGNGFTTSSSLVKHRRTHSGERPFACDLCHMRFAASGTLKNHRRTHTGEKPYQCIHCEKAFVQKNDLVSHVRCHTGERPFVCNVCGSAFRKPAALRSHAKMHSRDKEIMPY
ncbi:zinc finger protein OZF-like [Cydia amplana]|uniref:zinc finger protein OZF-like n=1 Tax=Cydia amplana TaxID=1869771 RepID=UPI002FE5A6C8